MIIPYFCRSKLIDGKIINETVIGLAFCTKPRKTWTWRVQKDKPQKITVSLITVKLLSDLMRNTYCFFSHDLQQY